MRHAFAVALAALFGLGFELDVRADETNWATKRASELVDAGEEHQRLGEVDAAIDNYRQAIASDPTFGRAYIALATLRTATGDLDEAERTYAAGIDHVLGFVEAHVARAKLLIGEHKYDAAVSDLVEATALDPTNASIANRLCEAAISSGRLPLALAAARRLVEIARVAGDQSVEKSARVTAAALSRLLGPVDPVIAGADRGPVRRAIARASNK
jgi:tetratricopeptide (TPR) repeat protein